MNAFVIGAFALIVGLVPLVLVAARGREIEGVAALELAGPVVALVFLRLGEGFRHTVYFDVATIAAAASWIGSLVFARFFGRYL